MPDSSTFFLNWRNAASKGLLGSTLISTMEKSPSSQPHFTGHHSWVQRTGTLAKQGLHVNAQAHKVLSSETLYSQCFFSTSHPRPDRPKDAGADAGPSVPRRIHG